MEKLCVRYLLWPASALDRYYVAAPPLWWCHLTAPHVSPLESFPAVHALEQTRGTSSPPLSSWISLQLTLWYPCLTPNSNITTSTLHCSLLYNSGCIYCLPVTYHHCAILCLALWTATPKPSGVPCLADTIACLVVSDIVHEVVINSLLAYTGFIVLLVPDCCCRTLLSYTYLPFWSLKIAGLLLMWCLTTLPTTSTSHVFLGQFRNTLSP